MDPLSRFDPYGSGSLEGDTEGSGADELAPHIKQDIFFHVGNGERNPERIAHAIAEDIREGVVDANDVAAFMLQNGVVPDYSQGNSGHSQSAPASGNREPLTAPVQEEVRRILANGMRNPNEIARFIGQGVNPNHVEELMRRNGVEPDYSQGSSSSYVGAGASGSGSGTAAGQVEPQPAAEARNWGEPVAEWRSDGKALQSPGGTVYPNAVGPPSGRDSKDDLALSRFLHGTRAAGFTDAVAAKAINRSASSMNQLNMSLPEHMQRPKMTREQKAFISSSNTSQAARKTTQSQNIESSQEIKAKTGWEVKGDGLESPGGTLHPTAVGPPSRRNRADDPALSRFLHALRDANVTDVESSKALGRQGDSVISKLNNSLPADMRRPKRTGHQKASRSARELQEGGNTQVSSSQGAAQAAPPPAQQVQPPPHLVPHTQLILNMAALEQSNAQIARRLRSQGIPATEENVRAIREAFRRTQNQQG